jgi:hypothetical protein
MMNERIGESHHAPIMSRKLTSASGMESRNMLGNPDRKRSESVQLLPDKKLNSHFLAQGDGPMAEFSDSVSTLAAIAARDPIA